MCLVDPDRIGQIVAHAPDLLTLMKRAKAAGYPQPLVTAVPKQQYGTLWVEATYLWRRARCYLINRART